MRRFSFWYVILALVISITTTFLQIFPASILIERLTDSSGQFKIVIVMGLLWLILVIPLLLSLFVYNLITSKGRKEQEDLIDSGTQSGIVIRRVKSLYGAVFPLDIKVNGEKKGTLVMSKKIFIPLEDGKFEVESFAMMMQKENLSVEISGNRRLLRTGFRMENGVQNVYLELDE